VTHTTFDTQLLEMLEQTGAEQPQRGHAGPLLIAGEDADYACGALHVAELLARRDRVNAHVLGVVRPLVFPVSVLPDVDRDALDRWREQRTEDADETGESAAAEERDDVDEDSIQSFPASDPPGWISMWLGTPTNAKPL
jgi:hypothetical protein